jgi:predicted TIM-barrel fold metal-dependent hydrolase
MRTITLEEHFAYPGFLEQMVREHGFKGAVINGHHRGRYLDDKFFWPILERAESLSVPIYLHPTQPPKPVIEASYSGFSPLVSDMLAGPGWGWHIETAVHVIRLILGGVFDRYPKLQIVVRSAPISGKIFTTFSGFNFTATFLDLLLEVGVERIMFSADYPYASMTQARGFLNQLPVSTADKERIARSNAERLLRL